MPCDWMRAGVSPFTAVCASAGSETYTFTKWQDASTPVPVLDGCDMTKVYLTKGYEFLDAAGAQQYNTALEDFKRRTPRDVNMVFSTDLGVPGFQEHVLCYLGRDGTPAWVSSVCFVAASVFCCSLPYRMAFDRRVGCHSHHVKKLIGQ